MNLEKLKFPIGRFRYPTRTTEQDRLTWTDIIETFPDRLKTTVDSLPEKALDQTYRPEGWTGLQVINHLADSHVNSYIRFKWTLTEELPLIKTYEQGLWADLPDGRHADAGFSMDILRGIHGRWTYLLRSMTTEDFQKKLIHPEFEHHLSLEQMLALYAWHCNHHLAHIQMLR